MSAKESEEGGEEGGVDLVQMPEGDYCIHIFLECGKKFKTDDEDQIDFNALFNV